MSVELRYAMAQPDHCVEDGSTIPVLTTILK